MSISFGVPHGITLIKLVYLWGLSKHAYKILVMSPLNNGNVVIMKQIALPNK
jgi:hypothetical protein